MILFLFLQISQFPGKIFKGGTYRNITADQARVRHTHIYFRRFWRGSCSRSFLMKCLSYNIVKREIRRCERLKLITNFKSVSFVTFIMEFIPYTRTHSFLFLQELGFKAIIKFSLFLILITKPILYNIHYCPRFSRALILF